MLPLLLSDFYRPSSSLRQAGDDGRHASTSPPGRDALPKSLRDSTQGITNIDMDGIQYSLIQFTGNRRPAGNLSVWDIEQCVVFMHGGQAVGTSSDVDGLAVADVR